jgi:hypothetical protein
VGLEVRGTTCASLTRGVVGSFTLTNKMPRPLQWGDGQSIGFPADRGAGRE